MIVLLGHCLTFELINFCILMTIIHSHYVSTFYTQQMFTQELNIIMTHIQIDWTNRLLIFLKCQRRVPCNQRLSTHFVSPNTVLHYDHILILIPTDDSLLSYFTLLWAVALVLSVFRRSSHFVWTNCTLTEMWRSKWFRWCSIWICPWRGLEYHHKQL